MEETLVYIAFAVLPLVALLGIYLFFVKYRQHEKKSLSWWKLALGNLLVFLFVGSSSLLLGETYYRFWYDTTDTFMLSMVSEQWLLRHYQTNRVGARDNCEYMLVPPPGRRRVTFVGDSFAAGHGVNNVEERFANLLRKKYPVWDIQVLALLGYNSGNELALLKQCVKIGHKLDCTVLVYCLNDIEDLIPEWQEKYRQFSERFARERPGFLIQHSYLLNTLYYRRWAATCPELRDYFAIEHQGYFGAPWETHAVRLKAIRDLVQKQGGKLCVVTFPHLDLLGSTYSFRDVHHKLDEFWKSIGVAHLDLLPVYESYGPRRLCVNSSDAHPNPLAHALAADALAPFLEAQLKSTGGNDPPASTPRK
jgi:lysophospholipase L1-like esterase